jgi:hypothetical protein
MEHIPPPPPNKPSKTMTVPLKINYTFFCGISTLAIALIIKSIHFIIYFEFLFEETSTWLPNSVTSGFKARTKPRSLVSLADWFNNELNYDLIVSDTTDLTRATDPQHHFKCHQFVIHLRSAALLSALLEHQIGKVNHVPVVYLPDLLDLPDLLGYLLRLFYDDQLVEQDEKFRSLTELYKVMLSRVRSGLATDHVTALRDEHASLRSRSAALV